MGAVGSPQDIVARLRAALPQHWFADDAPVLGAVLGGFGAVWSQLHCMLRTVQRQSRIGSAEGEMLDMIAGDFFGARLVRRPGQGDTAFRAAILRELLRERATRAALTAVLTDLTGAAPRIFEPARPADTGAWGQALGYGVAGGWGSLALPFQCFVQVRRPSGQGIAGVEGYEALRADGLISARATSSRTTGGTYIDARRLVGTAGLGVPRVDWSYGAPVVLQEAASTNLLSWSEQFDNATWNRFAGSTVPVADATIAPDGSYHADAIVESTATGLHQIFQTVPKSAAALPYTFSVYLKALGGRYADLHLSDGAGHNVSFVLDPASGAVISPPMAVGGGFSVLAGSVLALGGGWYRAALSVTSSTAAQITAQIILNTASGSSYTGDGSSGVYLWGAQIEQAASASSYIPTSAGPAVRSAETVSIPATLPGGYGRGAIEWASLAMVQGQVTDADIYDATARTMPAAAIAWTAISS
jgi:hypothetical protein